MAAPCTLGRARVDDMPGLLAHGARLGWPPRWEEPVPTPGTGVGLRLGGCACGGCPPRRSAGDHRRHHVAPWATLRLPPRPACTGPPVHPVAVRDARGATGLEAGRDATRWRAGAGALQPPTGRVEALQPAGGRRARPTANGQGRVTEDGRCPVGPRPEPRPDLPQGTSRVSAVAPRGLPVATAGVPGPRAAAPRERPAITRVRAGLRRRGLRSGGDGPLGALATRACIQAGGDPSVGPWSEPPRPPAVWAASWTPVWTGEPPWRLRHRPPPGGPPERLAAGVEPVAPGTAEGAGHRDRGEPRRGVRRSCPLAPAGARGRRARRATAPAALPARQTRRRGRRRWTPA
jgi:hypothetical protein